MVCWEARAAAASAPRAQRSPSGYVDAAGRRFAPCLENIFSALRAISAVTGVVAVSYDATKSPPILPRTVENGDGQLSFAEGARGIATGAPPGDKSYLSPFFRIPPLGGL